MEIKNLLNCVMNGNSKSLIKEAQYKAEHISEKDYLDFFM